MTCDKKNYHYILYKTGGHEGSRVSTLWGWCDPGRNAFTSEPARRIVFSETEIRSEE